MTEADPDILAVLSPRVLISAYAQGAFPMVQDGEVLWFSPEIRGLMPLDERFHISRRLDRTIRSGRFECTVDRCFPAVMDLCAEDREPDGTWISPEMKLAYGRLHRAGLAHSVEVWPAGRVGRGRPAGGLYGVTLGAAFFAESMFHRVTDAGKVAVVHLVERLRSGGFLFCDVQWTTPNLRRFGAYDVPRQEYLALLERALRLQCHFAPGPDAERKDENHLSSDTTG